MTAAALWCRVSNAEGQTTENQLVALRAWAEREGYTITREYLVEASAFTGKHRPQLKTALEDARRGVYDVLLVWALDRLSREGPEETLATMRRFHERGVQVLSREEGWTAGPREMQEVLIAFVAWVAQQESRRRSERVRAAMALRRAKGLPVGRQPGAKDLKPRKRSGYFAREERKRG